MNEARAALIWCPFANSAQAQAVAETLLVENLIACANIIPGLLSVFRWEGEIQSSNEAAALMKTTAPKLAPATARLAQLHPYEVPAIAGWLIDEMPDITGQWLAKAAGHPGL